MSAASLRLGAGPDFRERPQPGYARSIALALAVHLLLIGVLFVGVRFQSSAPETVSVELWDVPAPPRVAEPPPPPPKVEPKVEPPPPKPEVKPEPKIEKPEIVEKAAPKPKPKPKPEPEPKPKVEAKPKPPARDLEFEKRMREELAQEQAASEQRSVREQLAREQAAASARALNEYVARIQAKVRSNWILPPDLQGNPEAIFLVSQLPNGEVLTVRTVKSSSIPAYDRAVERAILKSSPLPLPASKSDFSRELKLTFRPQDQ
jgi:colicin import membrane protein